MDRWVERRKKWKQREDLLPFVQSAVIEANSISGFLALYSMTIRVCPSSYSGIHGFSGIWILGWGSDQAECPTSPVTDVEPGYGAVLMRAVVIIGKFHCIWALSKSLWTLVSYAIHSLICLPIYPHTHSLTRLSVLPPILPTNPRFHLLTHLLIHLPIAHLPTH